MWNRDYTLGWVAILSILACYELYAVIHGGKADHPLTQVTVRYCPWWVTMSVLTWLWWHFFVRYIDSTYVNTLRSGGTP
jgi:hypothetical protein